MHFQILPHPKQLRLYLALADIQIACQLLNRLCPEIPPDKYFPAFGVQCFQKTIDRCGGFPALDLVLYTFAGWNTFFQFVQKRLRLAASALLGMPCPIFTDRKVSHYFSQKSRQKFRFPGGNRVPGMQPGIVDAFLAVLFIV